MCSGSVVVTAYDSEFGCPGSNPEWGLIYYEAPITAQALPEPSSLQGSTLGTRAAEHKGCNWACKLTDGCSLKSCVRPHLLAYATEIKSTQLHAVPLWMGWGALNKCVVHLHSLLHHLYLLLLKISAFFQIELGLYICPRRQGKQLTFGDTSQEFTTPLVGQSPSGSHLFMGIGARFRSWHQQAAD